MRFSDIKVGDVIKFERSCLLVLFVDHNECFFTHLSLYDNHRPENTGTIYTTPSMKNIWGLKGDGEIIQRGVIHE